MAVELTAEVRTVTFPSGTILTMTAQPGSWLSP
jgi:hypothetical protein